MKLICLIWFLIPALLCNKYGSIVYTKKKQKKTKKNNIKY